MRRAAEVFASLVTRLRETIWPGTSRHPTGGGSNAGPGQAAHARGRLGGEAPMTAAQRAYLEILARELGERVPPRLTKAQASDRIDELRQRRLRERRRQRKARLKVSKKTAGPTGSRRRP